MCIRDRGHSDIASCVYSVQCRLRRRSDGHPSSLESCRPDGGTLAYALFVQHLLAGERKPYGRPRPGHGAGRLLPCLLYTSDAADDLLCVDLGGRRILKKKKNKHNNKKTTK